MGNKSTKTGNNVVNKDNFVAVDDSMLISNSGSDLLHKETCSSNDVADERRGVLIVTDSGSMPSKLSLSKVSLTETESPTSSVVSSVTDGILPLGGDIKREFAVRDWDGLKMYSDFVREGLQQLGQETDGVLMLYESPSSSSENTSFHNSQVFNYHDFPPFPSYYKMLLAPCRYSVMNGSTYSSYLHDSCPPGLVQHWKDSIPNFQVPSFTPHIQNYSKVYAYLPVEHLDIHRHVINPHVHYHLAGKDALNLMTDKTTRLLANTQDERPCVAKVTHAMGSKGIFVIRNDDDEVEFNEFLKESGNPNFVITEFVDIQRNIACHFFIHPSGEITWIGSNENVLLPNGEWSTDSTIIMSEQEHLKEIQLPFVQDVARYARQNGFWGFCGCDVLFDASGKGYLVDVNPRVTGTSPALMIAKLLQDEYGFGYGLFRRNSTFEYRGRLDSLLAQVKEYNDVNMGTSRIVLHAIYEKSEECTAINIAVYGHSLEACESVLDRFAPAVNEQ